MTQVIILLVSRPCLYCVINMVCGLLNYMDKIKNALEMGFNPEYVAKYFNVDLKILKLDYNNIKIVNKNRGKKIKVKFPLPLKRNFFKGLKYFYFIDKEYTKKKSHSNIIKNKDFYLSKKRYGGLREEVFKKDNYMCQLCGSETQLCVHHIDCNKNNNTMDNFVLLCLKHHRFVHAEYKKYGIPC